MTKLLLLLYLCFTTNVFANDIIDLKDLDKTLKQEKYNKLVNINEGKIEVDQHPDIIYNFSTNKYYTVITYNDTQVRNLTDRSKKFLKKWLKAKYVGENVKGVDTQMTLINNQIGMFYKEMVIVENGKLYNFIVQTPILTKLNKIAKNNVKIQLELMYLGKNYISGNNFFVITDFLNIAQNKSNTTTIKENDFIVAKSMISNEQYSAAIQKLNNFLKQNPNHLEARKNICIAKYLSSLKLNNPKYLTEAINCYEDLIETFESSEIYYTLASMYYSNSLISDKEKFNNVLKYSNKAVQMFKTSHNTGSDSLIYCGSVYLRGLAKIYFKDNDGLMDIENVQNKCPEMIGVNVF